MKLVKKLIVLAVIILIIVAVKNDSLAQLGKLAAFIIGIVGGFGLVKALISRNK